MCYYSRTMQRSEFRNVKVGEDLTLIHDHTGHAMLAGEDGKVVCVRNDTMIHIETFEVDPRRLAWTHANPMTRQTFRSLVGKPVSAKFVEYHAGPDTRTGYASDAIEVNGVKFHLAWMKAGIKCYVGDKRVTLETKLGVDDPSIVHDHKPMIDETPTLSRMLVAADGTCSITR